MRKHLVVISHTEHFKTEDDTVLGWGSTITELNYLAQHWEKITHVACLYEGKPMKGLMPYSASNIYFKAIPPFGGKNIVQKLSIIFKFFKIKRIIKSELKTASEVQLRLPTGIGVLLLPWFTFRRQKYKFWVKYAGNWVQESPPLGYAFQRWWLKKNFAHCPVTINGNWANQAPHLYTFENPCLSLQDIKSGSNALKTKIFEQSPVFCFVGRIASNKGIPRIMAVISALEQDEKKCMFHFVGDGPLIQDLTFLKNKLKFVKLQIHGFLTRNETFDIYKSSHVILLPSDSEGFPKVIAEAMNFACVPIVSDVSCIGQYVNDQNGFLWDITDDFTSFFLSLDLSPTSLSSKAKEAHQSAQLFTYDHYYNKIQLMLKKIK